MLERRVAVFSGLGNLVVTSLQVSERAAAISEIDPHPNDALFNAHVYDTAASVWMWFGKLDASCHVTFKMSHDC